MEDNNISKIFDLSKEKEVNVKVLQIRREEKFTSSDSWISLVSLLEGE